MQAAVFAGDGRLSLEDRPRPSVSAPDDVLIAVEACGICGTDLKILDVPPGHPATPGTILGHEFIGRVAAVGGDVRNLAVGTRVTVDADPKCGVCDPCRTGRPASCLNVVALGIFRDGALASHVLAPAGAVYPISDQLAPEVAALAEPLACVVNGTRRAALRPGESALIFGAGAIGCLFLAVFRAAGAGTIVVVEPSPPRAAIARALGADAVVTPDALTGELQRRLLGGADVVVDAVGSLLGAAVEATATGGRVVVFGMDSNARPPIHQVEITEKSLTIMGTYISNFTFPEAITLLESGRLHVAPMLTHVLPLTRIEAGMDLLRSGEATKVVVVP
jgi:threonine dehydrogenase-like Zn-dependent dehydrogenase